MLSSDNYIDGTEFFNLTEDEVKAMVPPLGLHQKIFQNERASIYFFYVYKNVFFLLG